MCNTQINQVFLSELVTEIYQFNNIKIQYQKYSWSLAKLEVKEGRILGILSPSKMRLKAFIFLKAFS